MKSPMKTITYNDKLFREIPGYPRYYVSKDAEVYSEKTSRLLVIRHADKDEAGCFKYDIVILSDKGKVKPMPLHKLVALAWCPLPKGYTTKQVLGTYMNHTLVVDHKDGNKTNNHASNLRWATSLENSNANNYNTQTRRDKLKGNTHAKGRRSNGEPTKYYMYTYNGKEYTLSEIILKLGCTKSKITESFRRNVGLVKSGELTRREIDRHVSQLDLEGNLLNTFDSPDAASAKVEIRKAGILSALNGRQATCGGFIWKWTRNIK